MKKILILLIPFFLTGCASVSYNLDISKNLEIKEEVYITGTKEYFNDFYKNYPITIVKEWYQNEDILTTLNNNKYEHELITEGVTYPQIFVKKNYNSLTEYSNNTIFKGQSFENIYIITTNELITIKASNFLPYLEDEDNGRYSVSNLKINIKVPFTVTSHNANSYNKKTNTYTWIIDKNTQEKDLEITFNKNKIYVYNFAMYISIIILIIIIISIILIIRMYIKKNKYNNQIID